jgi:secondary thiamine-phosphate synthase enzyme
MGTFFFINFKDKQTVKAFHQQNHMVNQKEIIIGPFKRGFHLITQSIEKQLDKLPETGIVNIHLKHTSAALTLNENADPSVRLDFKGFVDKLVPENDAWYTHTLEGDDDMPAHLKSSLLGQSITIPVTHHRLNLGTWQGIYLCEFRNYGGSRELVLTIIG